MSWQVDLHHSRGRGRSGDDGVVRVRQLCFDESDCLPELDNLSFSVQRTRSGRSKEGNIQVDRGGEGFTICHHPQGRTHGVVEHRGQDASLNKTCGILERVLADKAKANPALRPIEIDHCLAQQTGRLGMRKTVHQVVWLRHAALSGR